MLLVCRNSLGLILAYPHLHLAPLYVWPSLNFVMMFGQKKLSPRAIVWRCLSYPRFSRFDLIPGVTHTHAQSQTHTHTHDGICRASIASRGKTISRTFNVWWFVVLLYVDGKLQQLCSAVSDWRLFNMLCGDWRNDRVVSQCLETSGR